MNIRNVLLLLSVFYSQLLFASFENVTISPNTIASGNISGFQIGDTSIPYFNSEISYISLNYLYPFGLLEISREDVSIQAKIFGLNSFFRVINFGNNTYRENTINYSASMFTLKNISINSGISLFYLHTEFENIYSVGIDISAFYKIFDNFEGLCAIKNLYAYENDNIDIPLEMFLNLHYLPMENLDVYLGVEKDDRYKANIKTGVSYLPIEYLSLSMGYNFEPKNLNTGFTINFSNYKFSYALSYHFDLEYSHAIGILYEI
ncbi:MAG: hypothetical protein KAH33_02930 [Candidatus Delongbacteria bacterium]|nr:hypothetical protein [Candidatus Delongbacteria bacterium]